MTAQLKTDRQFRSDREKTFEYDEGLPDLPLPNLHDTLQKYVLSVRPHVNDEEYLRTKTIVEKFENGIGKELHERLLSRSKNMKNWLETWWNDTEYMEGRGPASPLINMASVSPHLYNYFTPKEGSQIERAALITHYTLKAWQLLHQEKWMPDRNSKGEVFSMHQYRNLFNTCKIPGVQKDKIESYFKTVTEGLCSHSLVVGCRGRLFHFDAIDGNGEPLTAPELQQQLQFIRDTCDNQSAGIGIGCLTGDKRTSWAQLRSRLVSLHPQNWENLQLIQKSLLLLSLEDTSVKNEEEVIQSGLFGDPTNKWFDKSFSLQFYKNGLVSSNCDHAAADAMGLVTTTVYVDSCVKEVQGKWRGSTRIRQLQNPDELQFVVDDVILKGIENARQLYNSNALNMTGTLQHFNGYGKQYLKSFKLHPDTHMQLALQYAYYRMYKKMILGKMCSHQVRHLETAYRNLNINLSPATETFSQKLLHGNHNVVMRIPAFVDGLFSYFSNQVSGIILGPSMPAPTYETATIRKFYHGRRETVRSCSVEAVEWCKAMLDPSISSSVNYKLYLTAAERHNRLMDEATNNRGCEGHLLGLRKIAEELNIQEPDIFKDPSFTKSGGGDNFILITSLIGYTNVIVAGASKIKNGYGISYAIEESRFVFYVGGFKKFTETNMLEFAKLIHLSLTEMKELLDQNITNIARL